MWSSLLIVYWACVVERSSGSDVGAYDSEALFDKNF